MANNPLCYFIFTSPYDPMVTLKSHVNKIQVYYGLVCVKVLIFMIASTAADLTAVQDHMKINRRKAERHQTVCHMGKKRTGTSFIVKIRL